MKQEYKQYSSDELDPLDRFTFDIISKEECLFQEWFVVDDENDASHLGLFFETLLACHALQHETCYNCKYQNALRWNGGGSSSWQDLVCVICKSTYEVKTKANTERVENAFKWNAISGGSFSRWCQLNNEKRQPDQKRYLVVLPRTPTFNRQLNKVYPVQIAEISAVLPSLYPGSFDPTKRPIRFKSTISVKIKTKAKWFDLPSTYEKVNTLEIAERVFIERFSQQTFDSLMEMHFCSDDIRNESDDVRNNDNNTSNVYIVSSVDGANNGIEQKVIEGLINLNLNNVPDDWEDLASDEE